MTVELIGTAFLLGLVGSLHCAAMCGPLVLALGRTGRGQLAHHTGRIAVYAGLGWLVGGIGQTLALAGLQRWLSILAGCIMLMGLLLSTPAGLNLPAARLTLKFKSAFAGLLRRRTWVSEVLLGAMNGLLPCGLVYFAAATAVAAGRPLEGALNMVAFGAGTLPVLFGVGFSRQVFQSIFRFRPERLIPISVFMIALLLIVRGLALGIPYLSPALHDAAVHPCHY